MRSFQRDRRWKNIAYSKPILILLGIVVLFFISSVLGFLGKMQETSRNKEIAKNKVAELQAQKAQLSASIAKLQTEEGIEENIREKFGLAKEGEGLIVVVDDKDDGAAEKNEESGGFFNFLKNLFK